MNLQPLIDLDYHFPSPDASALEPPARDPNLQQNLKLDEIKPKEAVISKFPLVNNYLNKVQHPLQDILLSSQAAINNYKLQLPSDAQVVERPAIRSPRKPIASRTRGSKRSRNSDSDDLDYSNYSNNSYCQTNDSSVFNTPIPNKTIFFSPAGSGKKNVLQSTPVSVLKETHLNKKNKLLKYDKAKLVKESNKENIGAVGEDSDYDHLACHAENILRMAVDSTMLGSTFNSSFSSVNDSIMGKRELFEEDGDRSVIEILKSKRNNLLKKLQATKIEISAEDLKNAVSG